MAPLALTIRGTSEATGLGKTSLYKLIADNKLTAVKIGRRTLVTVASIKALLEDGTSPVSNDERGA